jgi:hypothetical protein
MKKIILSVAASCMLLIAAPHETMAREKQTMKTESSTSHEQAQKLIGRLHEIKEMDKTKLSPAEKSKLHKEVLSIRIAHAQTADDC